MSHSTISLGLGLGGGKAATSNGRLAGGGFDNSKSVVLDGTNDDLYLDSGISLSGAFTISIWFKHESGNYPYLIDSYVFLYGAPAGFRVLVRGAGTITSATDAYALNAWYNLVFRRDGSNNVEVFIDGTSVGTSSFTGTPSIQQFGRNGSFDPLGGNIDECAIWTSNLSDADRHGIRGETSAGSKGIPADLDGLSAKPSHWWRCGDLDDSGTTSQDRGTATAVNMSLRNGASFEADVPS